MKNYLLSLALSLGALAIFFGCACATEPEEIVVMSFNIRFDNPGDGENRWKLRCKAAVECIEDYAPGIIGIQEALVSQVEYLEKALPNYVRVGVGRDDGATQGEYAAIFYDAERFELLWWENNWLSETPEIPSLGWDAVCKRVVTHIILRDKSCGRKIHAINTHFDHVGKQARIESAKMILEKIEAAGDDAVVFTGDLNEMHGSETINTLLDSGLLRDSYNDAQCHKGATYSFHAFRGESLSEGATVIDYVMFNKQLKARENITVSKKYRDRVVSDHYPIVARLKYADVE
ncbi:MAG: endonuclease/exonuclease/phosphatase family protein [Rikenellaceae bacterium]